MVKRGFTNTHKFETVENNNSTGGLCKKLEAKFMKKKIPH